MKFAFRFRLLSVLSLVVTGASACGSFNPYRGPTAKLLPPKVASFERELEAKELDDRDRARLIPELTKGLLNAAVGKYRRIGNRARETWVYAYGFESSERAREALQFIKQGSIRRGLRVEAEVSRKRGWSTVGETLVLTKEPEKDFPKAAARAFWRNGSVIFYAEPYGENQLEDVKEFERNFPY